MAWNAEFCMLTDKSDRLKLRRYLIIVKAIPTKRETINEETVFRSGWD